MWYKLMFKQNYKVCWNYATIRTWYIGTRIEKNRTEWIKGKNIIMNRKATTKKYLTVKRISIHFLNPESWPVISDRGVGMASHL